MDQVRCHNCKGNKKISGFGNIVADCNLCKGTGYVSAAEILKAAIKSEPVADIVDIKKQVADVVAIEPEIVVEQDIKVDAKRATFKRKNK